MLTEQQCPWTGPYGLPESGLRHEGPTAEALKRFLWRLELFHGPPYDQGFNKPLSDGLARWDPGHTGYGKGRWEKARKQRIPKGKEHAGEYALDAVALQLIREDYAAQHPAPPPYPSNVYPHEKGWASYCGGYLHETGGIGGNWAYDFLAAAGTPVLAPEAGTVSRTSGYDPATGLHGSNRDVFGWSVYLRCRGGFYYSTHYGRLVVAAGTQVLAGQLLGFVGAWPHDPPRSHTHLGYTSFTHLSYLSKNRIRAVAAAPRVEARGRV